MIAKDRATIVVLLFCVMSGVSYGQSSGLGDVEFPTSGSTEAQEHFLAGVKYLHSFGFDAASSEFERAIAIDSGFAMAYWGAALSHNHPVLRERDLDSPRAVLRRLGPTPAARAARAPTERERGFLSAIEILYGLGTEEERAFAYASAMEDLVSRFPEDPEVRAFYVVAHLATVKFAGDSWGSESTFPVRMKAGTVALQLFDEQANHPGAAHYVIHAFDDPIHASIALPAARRYAEIAPALPHALHMPSHIFIQHGMWDEVVASNDESYEVALARWEGREALTETERFFADTYVWHALDWGQYGSLQRGDYEKALQAIELLRPIVAETTVPFVKTSLRDLEARYQIETERWHSIEITDKSIPEEMLAGALAASQARDLTGLQAITTRMDALAIEDSGDELISIMRAQISALTALADGRPEAAIESAASAAALAEERGLPNGSVQPMKPAHELYGEILLELGHAEEAQREFEKSLSRTPRRALSLRGQARASAELGDTANAIKSYGLLLEVWDTRGAPAVRLEAERYISQVHLDITDVTFQGRDGVILTGTYYAAAAPGPGVLLLHQCDSRSRRSWDSTARLLAAEGMHVLAYDHRGFGESGGSNNGITGIHDAMTRWRDVWRYDAMNAINFLTSQENVAAGKVAVGGASCGGFVALELARESQLVESLVLLGGPVDEVGLQGLADAGPIPVFGAITAEDVVVLDSLGTKSTKDIIDYANHPRSKLHIYRGSGHGVDMYGTEPNLLPEIVRWFKSSSSMTN